MLVCGQLYGQKPFTIYGSISGSSGVENSTALLRSFSVDEFVPIAQISINNGAFEVSLSDNPKHGLYLLDLGNLGVYEFIVGPTDSDLHLKILLNQPSNRIFENSIENEAYFELLEELGYKNHLTDSIGYLRGSVSRVDKQYYTKKNAYREKVDRAIQAHHLRLDLLQNEYPKTYTTEVLIPLLRGKTMFDSEVYLAEYDNHHSFHHFTFLDNINLNDARLLRHPLFAQQLRGFLREYSGEFDADHIDSVDRLFKKCQNEKVRSFLLNLTTRHYWKSGERDVAKYIVSNYSDGCGDDLDELSTADGILYPQLKTGDQIPPFSWNDGGETILSSDLFSKHRLTLLVFWRSDCDHCEKEIPIMAASYTQYADKGLGVIALSLDKDEVLWKRKDEALIPSGWLSLLQKDVVSRDRLSNQLSVYSTPSNVLIDGNGRFLASNVFRERLDKFLAGYLK